MRRDQLASVLNETSGAGRWTLAGSCHRSGTLRLRIWGETWSEREDSNLRPLSPNEGRSLIGLADHCKPSIEPTLILRRNLFGLQTVRSALSGFFAPVLLEQGDADRREIRVPGYTSVDDLLGCLVGLCHDRDDHRDGDASFCERRCSGAAHIAEVQFLNSSRTAVLAPAVIEVTRKALAAI